MKTNPIIRRSCPVVGGQLVRPATDRQNGYYYAIKKSRKNKAETTKDNAK